MNSSLSFQTIAGGLNTDELNSTNSPQILSSSIDENQDMVGSISVVQSLDGEINTTSIIPDGIHYTEMLAGKSAYQIAVDNGFVGTEQEWLDSLVSDLSESDLQRVIAAIKDEGFADVAFSGDYNDLINQPTSYIMQKLIIGNKQYDGSQEVVIDVYDGNINDLDYQTQENMTMVNSANQMTMTNTSNEMTMTTNLYNMTMV